MGCNRNGSKAWLPRVPQLYMYKAIILLSAGCAGSVCSMFTWQMMWCLPQPVNSVLQC